MIVTGNRAAKVGNVDWQSSIQIAPESLKTSLIYMSKSNAEMSADLGRGVPKSAQKSGFILLALKTASRLIYIYRQFLICSPDNLSLVIPNNKTIEH